MKIENLIYSDSKWSIESVNTDVNIVFVFGDREAIKEESSYIELKKLYPNADIVGCSSSGNIQGDRLSSASIVASAVTFSSGYVKISTMQIDSNEDQVRDSAKLVKELESDDLKHIFVLSDGLNMNGSLLAEGVNSAYKNSISITGGLAGDGLEFEETYIVANAPARNNIVVAIGFYGKSLHVSSGCYSGWEEFGIFRTITKSTTNIVYEIDNQPALGLYKKYLGEYAKDLPNSGLLFPFNVKDSKESTPVIRSVLAVDEDKNSLIFAGDVKEGSLARLMKSDIDSLIDASEIAAKDISQENSKSALCLVVSCVGRRAVLNQLSDEELESISMILGDNVELTGFYSYGELAPHSNEILNCQLHNQTMTLTAIYEG